MQDQRLQIKEKNLFPEREAMSQQSKLGEILGEAGSHLPFRTPRGREHRAGSQRGQTSVTQGCGFPARLCLPRGEMKGWTRVHFHMDPVLSAPFDCQYHPLGWCLPTFARVSLTEPTFFFLFVLLCFSKMGLPLLLIPTSR